MATIPDNYTKHGAGVLAALVEKYWHGRGHRHVKAERYELGANVPGMWGVRSNLVAGLPPARSVHTMQQGS